MFTVVVIIPGLYTLTIYNGLRRAQVRAQNAFSQIDVQLKRRFDLIPNLVESVKGYMAHERDTLEAVIKARNQAVAAAQTASGSPGNPAAMMALGQAEGALTGVLGKMFALAESYPDLKANQNMLALQEELTSTENKVSFARQAFNDAVMSYNNSRETFPGMLLAGGFPAAQSFAIEVPAEREPVKVSF